MGGREGRVGGWVGGCILPRFGGGGGGVGGSGGWGGGGGDTFCARSGERRGGGRGGGVRWLDRLSEGRGRMRGWGGGWKKQDVCVWGGGGGRIYFVPVSVRGGFRGCDRYRGSRRGGGGGKRAEGRVLRYDVSLQRSIHVYFTVL